DKEIDSPYNTYKHTGLPPGPITIPKISSIDAVLDFQQNDFLYMCAKEDFSGKHNFAKTLDEHNHNAEKYRKALNENKIIR
ncbi:MAG: endolytic transglycosylase MltG, partial [Bacteroidota bacterium]